MITIIHKLPPTRIQEALFKRVVNHQGRVIPYEIAFHLDEDTQIFAEDAGNVRFISFDAQSPLSLFDVLSALICEGLPAANAQFADVMLAEPNFGKAVHDHIKHDTLLFPYTIWKSVGHEPQLEFVAQLCWLPSSDVWYPRAFNVDNTMRYPFAVPLIGGE